MYEDLRGLIRLGEVHDCLREVLDLIKISSALVRNLVILGNGHKTCLLGITQTSRIWRSKSVLPGSLVSILMSLLYSVFSNNILQSRKYLSHFSGLEVRMPS